MPKITCIEVQKRNKDRVNVYVDDQFLVGVSAYAAAKHKLQVDQEVDPAKLESVLFEDELEKAKGYITNYLMNKTQHILIEKLTKKGFDEAVVQKALEWAKNYKFVDDEDYARKFAKDGSNLKKNGKRMIAQKLKQKGVEQTSIDKALSAISESDELASAAKALKSKIETYKRKTNSEREWKQKCIQFLMGRGYGFDIAKKTMEMTTYDED
jgi:regulatory protein